MISRGYNIGDEGAVAGACVVYNSTVRGGQCSASGDSPYGRYVTGPVYPLLQDKKGIIYIIYGSCRWGEGGVLCVGRGVMVIDQARCQPETPSAGPGYPFGVRTHIYIYTRAAHRTHGRVLAGYYSVFLRRA